MPRPLSFCTPKEALVEDDRLVAAFEGGQLPDGGFHHRDHVRVAWYYLRRDGLHGALPRFSDALKRFAVAQGKPDLYHETITTAYVLLINERLDEDGAQTWDDFAARHSDLLTWRPSVLDRYYSPGTLATERARRTFVFPDRGLRE
jgi:hypothetical protein